MKKVIIMLAAAGAIFCLNMQAFAAQTIGYVDMSRVLSGYSKAQAITNQVKDQQTEIQKMITEARNQINSAKTDNEKKELESKLSEEIQQKNNVLRADYEKSVQTLQNNIFESVKKVATKKKVDCILRKDYVITGGADLTEDVLAELNKR